MNSRCCCHRAAAARAPEPTSSTRAPGFRCPRSSSRQVADSKGGRFAKPSWQQAAVPAHRAAAPAAAGSSCSSSGIRCPPPLHCTCRACAAQRWSHGSRWAAGRPVNRRPAGRWASRKRCEALARGGHAKNAPAALQQLVSCVANGSSHLVDVGVGDVGIHVVLAVALPQRLLHCSGAGWAAPQ